MDAQALFSRRCLTTVGFYLATVGLSVGSFLMSAPASAAQHLTERQVLERAESSRNNRSDHVTLRLGRVGRKQLAVMDVANSHAKARVAFRGSHILSYLQNGLQAFQLPGRKAGRRSADVLYVSSETLNGDGRAIRGGIPWATPYFGPHPTEGPLHGFVRELPFRLDSAENLSDGRTKVTLSLLQQDWQPYVDKAVWEHPLDFQMTIIVGPTLEISAATKNLDRAPVVIAEALHTYFSTPDITKTQIVGIGGKRYRNKVSNTITPYGGNRLTLGRGEIDHVVYDTQNRNLSAEMPGRRIAVRSIGADSAVIWNPGIGTKKTMSLSDLPDGEVCGMFLPRNRERGTKCRIHSRR